MGEHYAYPTAGLTMKFFIAVAVTICSTFMNHDALAGSHWKPTPAQQSVLKTSEEETKTLLAILIYSAGLKCTPISYRRLGLDPGEGALYYIESCREDDYIVALERDEGATGVVLACPVLELATKRSCNSLNQSDFINPFPLP